MIFIVVQVLMSHDMIMCVQFYMLMYLFTLYNKIYSYIFEYSN